MEATKEKTLHKILVIDDDDIIVKIVKNYLTPKGYEIFTASDGEEGAKLVKEKKPDLIILDIMLPIVDGWTFIRKLRSSSQYSLLPVIMLSSLSDPEDRLKGFSMGADDYLIKPFRVQELEFRVRSVLQKSKKIAENVKHLSENALSIGFHGILEELGVASLLTLMGMEQKTGILHLTSSQGENAQVYFKKGTLVHANLDKSDEVNHEVIYYLLTWKKGVFHFKNEPVIREDEIQCPLSGLLMEGARIMDEYSK